jgi:predicted site-specific integrase-resolvase
VKARDAHNGTSSEVPIRTAIYARVSTIDKGQDTDNQLLQLREYCTRQGWPSRTNTSPTPADGGGCLSAYGNRLR